MGTRADFYIKRGKDLDWRGSIAWDGYPWNGPCYNRKLEKLIFSSNEKEFQEQVDFIERNERDFTNPKQGWPWPWEDSCTTDYAYILMDGKVMCSNYGYPLFDPKIVKDDDSDDDETSSKMVDFFPNMESIQKVDFGARSGIMIFGVKE